MAKVWIVSSPAFGSGTGLTALYAVYSCNNLGIIMEGRRTLDFSESRLARCIFCLVPKDVTKSGLQWQLAHCGALGMLPNLTFSSNSRTAAH